MSGYDFGFFSHFPILASALSRSLTLWPDLPILELGSGWGSTPLIHYGSGGRYVITADTQQDWLSNFYGYRSDSHLIELIGWKKIDKTSNGVSEQIGAWKSFVQLLVCKYEFGIVFVDQAPGEARVPCIKLLKGHAKFIIAHDTCSDDPPGGGNYKWRELNGLFKYEEKMKRLRPATTVYSDVESLGIEKCDS